jgi:hypothetical protein
VASADTAAALRRRYGVPDTVRLRAEGDRVIAWVEGAEDAAGLVAATPDALPPRPGTAGRAPLARLDSPLGSLVVRETRKGGLLRRLRGRRFRGAFRPLAEMVLGRRCLGAGVPVAEAVGAVVLGGGRGWRGFLLTREVEGGVDLEAWLYGEGGEGGGAGSDPAGVLRAAGRSVRALHDAGVRHADLHPKNLLLGRDGRVLVLDLDRARAFDGPLSEEDRLKNLARLARAVEKHRLRGMRVSRRRALRFLEGYGGSRAAAAAWLDRVRARATRGLVLRAAWWRLTGQVRPALPRAAAGGA